MHVDAATGASLAVEPVEPSNPFGAEADSGDFAMSRDGHLLAIVRQIAKGDIWVLEAARGRY
jgi:hypothetical protein